MPFVSERLASLRRRLGGPISGRISWRALGSAMTIATCPRWRRRAEGIADPNADRRLRGLFHEAGFSRIEAAAHYISYGTRDRIIAFARDRAVECRDRGLQTRVMRQGIASPDELTRLATSWEEWGRDPGAFFAFPWCRVLAWS